MCDCLDLRDEPFFCGYDLRALLVLIGKEGSSSVLEDLAGMGQALPQGIACRPVYTRPVLLGMLPAIDQIEELLARIAPVDGGVDRRGNSFCAFDKRFALG